MQEIIRKAMRTRPPVPVKLQLPAAIYDWYADQSDDYHCGISVLFRGVLVDFYDQHRDSEVADGDSEEVSE